MQVLERITFVLQARHAPAAVQSLLKLLLRIAASGTEPCLAIYHTPGLLAGVLAVLDVHVAVEHADAFTAAAEASWQLALSLLCTLCEASPGFAKVLGSQGECIR